jgi:integrase
MRFHDARHTAASIALESGIDIKVVSDQLGHATTKITLDLYQHVVRRLHDEAAERVASLISP